MMKKFRDEPNATEDYFFTMEQRGAERIVSNGPPKLVLNFFRRPENSTILMAKLEHRYGIRGTPGGRCFWHAVDFNFFLWALQGLCYEIFFPSKGCVNHEDSKKFYNS